MSNQYNIVRDEKQFVIYLLLSDIFANGDDPRTNFNNNILYSELFFATHDFKRDDENDVVKFIFFNDEMNYNHATTQMNYLIEVLDKHGYSSSNTI